MDRQRREQLRRVIADRTACSGQDDWGQAVCAACVTVVAGVDAAALTVRTESRAQEMLGASDGWAAGLGESQYTLGEGPAVEAFRTRSPVLVSDVSVEQIRWPAFADVALSAGMAAVFAFPLQIGAIRLGTLDLYRRRVGGLSTPELADAAVLADLATLALLEHVERAERTGCDWTRPITSYQDVNVATGMLAAQLHISLDEAFVRLRAHAFGENRSVLAVARDVLARRLRWDRRVD